MKTRHRRIRRIGTLCLVLLLTSLLMTASGCKRTTDNPLATITMENGDVITLYLYPDKAPNTVANFISLANSGFYDGTVFHRTLTNYLIQGGDPEGTGTGGPGYYIEGEFSLNGYSKNDLSLTSGVIAMARFCATSDTDEAYFDTAGSQFFILCRDKSADYDGKYAGFGKVFQGMTVAKTISQSSTDANNRPKADQVIKTIRVETYGEDYGAPKTIAIPEN